MSNVYSLETLRADLDKKFAPVTIDLGGKTGNVVLRNLMRLGKTDRAAVVAAVKDVQEADGNTADGVETMLEATKTVLSLVADEDKGKSLADALGDDLGLAMHVLSLWSEATQPGEAQNSPA